MQWIGPDRADLARRQLARDAHRSGTRVRGDAWAATEFLVVNFYNIGEAVAAAAEINKVG
jgi:hypothetical protein